MQHDHAPRGGLTLTGRVLVLQFVLSVVAVGSGLAWFAWSSERTVPQRHQEAAAMAARVAGSRRLGADLAAGDRPAVAAVVAGVRRATGADFAVISAAGAGPAASDVAAGHPGATSRELWVVRAPIRSAAGRTVGELVVGLPPTWGAAVGAIRAGPVAEAAALALAVGLVGSALLARWLRAQTFGLELDELTELLQEQKATLVGIREGVIGLDETGKVRFVNDEARRLAGLPHRCLQRPLPVLVPGGRLREVLAGRIVGEDLMVVHRDRVLVVNRIPVQVEGHRLGWVVTIADRTESESLLRELDGSLSLTEALRAQAHDFSNRVHALVGLVELGEYAEAVRFGTEIQVTGVEVPGDDEHRSLGHPLVGALLLAKKAVARERQVALRISSSTRVEGELLHPKDLVTVIGNLVDNAVDAASGREPAWVEVELRSEGGRLEVTVADSGPGVPLQSRTKVFVDGYSTKRSPAGRRRGLGLAVLHQLVQRSGGEVTIGSDPRCGGASFKVTLPDAVGPLLADRAREVEAVVP